MEALQAPETADVGLIAGALLDGLFDVDGRVLHADRPKGDGLGQMSPPLPVVVLQVEDGIDHPISSLSEQIAVLGVDEVLDAARGHVLSEELLLLAASGLGVCLSIGLDGLDDVQFVVLAIFGRSPQGLLL